MGGVRVIRVLHGVPSLHPGQGGPSRTVVALMDALASGARVSVSLVSQGALDEPLVPSAIRQAFEAMINDHARASWA